MQSETEQKCKFTFKYSGETAAIWGKYSSNMWCVQFPLLSCLFVCCLLLHKKSKLFTCEPFSKYLLSNYSIVESSYTNIMDDPAFRRAKSQIHKQMPLIERPSKSQRSLASTWIKIKKTSQPERPTNAISLILFLKFYFFKMHIFFEDLFQFKHAAIQKSSVPLLSCKPSS